MDWFFFRMVGMRFSRWPLSDHIFYQMASKCNPQQVWVILKQYTKCYENQRIDFPVNCWPMVLMHFSRWLPGGHFVLSDSTKNQSQARLGHTEAV